MKESLKVLNKIAEAKKFIRNTKIEKKGRNTYSKYDYYTPDQIVNLVQDACEKAGIITLFSTHQNEFGLFAELNIVDLTSGENHSYFQVTAIPDIKATNIAQQLGGMNTYSNRYLLMFAFDIVDNNLDFDTTENTKKTDTKQAPKTVAKTPVVEKPVLSITHDKWDALVTYMKGGGTLESIRLKYAMSKKTEDALMEEVNG